MSWRRARAVPTTPVISTQTAASNVESDSNRLRDAVTHELGSHTRSSHRGRTRPTSCMRKCHQSLAGLLKAGRNVLDVLCFALRRATAGYPLVSEGQLEVDMVAVKGLAVVRTDGLRINTHTTKLIIAINVPRVRRLVVRKRANGRYATGIRAQAEVGDSHGMLVVPTDEHIAHLVSGVRSHLR